MIKFPKTPHLPFNSSAATDDDIIADEDAVRLIYNSDRVVVQEKLDGANLRIQFDGESEPTIGNREHVLKKGYTKKNTPAKLQFRPVWNWVYSNKKPFAKLSRMLEETPVVFGEWMLAQHTTKYDKLSTLFFAYDIFIDNIFLDPIETVELLTDAGFIVPPIINYVRDHGESRTLPKPDDLMKKLYELSPFSSTDYREGLYFKIGDGSETTHRFKVLRPDYKTISDFTERGLIKNGLSNFALDK